MPGAHNFIRIHLSLYSASECVLSVYFCKDTE